MQDARKNELQNWFAGYDLIFNDNLPLDCYEQNVFNFLCRAANKDSIAMASYNWIAKHCRMSRSKAISSIKKLESLGFIVKFIRRKSPKEHAINLYLIFDPKSPFNPNDPEDRDIVKSTMMKLNSDCQCPILHLPPSVSEQPRVVADKDQPSTCNRHKGNIKNGLYKKMVKENNINKKDQDVDKKRYVDNSVSLLCSEFYEITKQKLPTAIAKTLIDKYGFNYCLAKVILMQDSILHSKIGVIIHNYIGWLIKACEQNWVTNKSSRISMIEYQQLQTKAEQIHTVGTSYAQALRRQFNELMQQKKWELDEALF